MNYIIVDLEATCWQKGTSPFKMEIIEIGAVKLDGKTLEITDEFSSFVNPVINPELSDFCKNLTSITQEQIDAAEDFTTVFSEFIEWAGTEEYTLCSWGAYDRNQFRVDCRRHKIPFPEEFESHINIKKMFCELKNIKPCGMKRALNIIGIPLRGTHHRGIDDARNIAMIAKSIF